MEIFKVIIKNEILLSEYIKNLNFGIHRFNELINQKKVKINNKIVLNDQLLKKGDKLTIDLSAFSKNKDIDMPNTTLKLHVLYEDDYLLVVDKPDNMIIYADESSDELTLNHLVKKYYEENGLDIGVYHLHRLDRDTKGCILYAKDLVTLAALSKMMEEHLVVRHYETIVEGHFRLKKGTIDKPIAKDRHNNKMICNPNGKKAITCYEVLKQFKNNTSLVRINLKTGRTHQIRVHFASIKHPLVGDPIYNENWKNQKFNLISTDIEFIHPITGEKIFVKRFNSTK